MPVKLPVNQSKGNGLDWHSLYSNTGLKRLGIPSTQLDSFIYTVVLYLSCLLMDSLLFSCSLASLLRQYVECQYIVRGMPSKCSWNANAPVQGMPTERTGSAVQKNASECEMWKSVRGRPHQDHRRCTRNANRYALSLRIRPFAESSCSSGSGVWSTQIPCGTSLTRTDGQSVARMVIACRA